MKLPAKIVVWLLPFFLTSCFLHKRQQTQAPPMAPPVVDNPPPPPSTASVNLPPSAATIPTEPTKTGPTLPPKKPPRHKKPKAAAPVEEAANPAPNPGVSAIGQLSSGDPQDYQKQTEDSIADIEKKLNGITRTLSDTEEKTADHIREFLKQAKAALATGDVDGAHTLAAKAKVLLDELIE